MAINWAPQGILWAQKLSTWSVGLLGTLSSLCELYKYFNPATTLPDEAHASLWGHFSWCTQFEWSLGGSQPRISYTSSATPVAFGWSNRNISLSLHFDCMREQWNSWHIPQDWPLFDDDCNTIQAVIKPLMLGWENLILSTLLKWKLQVMFKGSSTTVITKWPIIYSLQYGKKRKMFEENLVRIKVRINKLK